MSGEAFAAAMASVAEAHERGYLEGHRAAWCALLQTALGHIRGPQPEQDTLVALGIVTLELDGVRAALRRLCDDFGDNDWSDDLHLVDVIEKHLAPYLGDEA